MFKRLLHVTSLLLLSSITVSFPLFPSQGQQPNRKGSSEITFIGKEETRWTEKREPPLPMLVVQGAKEGPRLDSLGFREDAIGEMQKMSPTATSPGCSYRSRFTRGVVVTLEGDKGLYERGRFQYYEGNDEEAIASFEKLVQNHPGSPLAASAHYWAGEAELRQGDDDGAYDHFHKAATKDPNGMFHEYALYSCGWIQFRRGRYDEGNRFFRQAYEKSPLHPIAESCLFWSGYCLYYLGRYDDTVQTMERLLRDFIQGKWRPESEYLMGVSVFRLQRFTEAAEHFRGFLRQYPRHPLVENARYAWAWSLTFLGQYGSARKSFEEILLDYPGTRLSDPLSWGIVKTYLGEDEVEKAVDLHQRYLTYTLSSPWLEQVLFDIGQHYFNKKAFTSAASIFRQFLWMYPENDLQEWAYFMLGESLFNDKDYVGAASAYQRVLGGGRKFDLESRAYGRLGYASFLAKDYDRAIQSWENLLKRFPHLPERNEIHYWLGEASLLRQNYSSAVRYFAQVKGDRAFYPKALNSLGWYHFQRSEWVKANDFFLALLEEFPEFETTPPTALLVGQCYLNQGDYPRAKKYLDQLASLPEGPDERGKTPYLLGWIAYRQERFEEAIEHFQTLLKMYPQSAYRDEAQYWTGWSYFRKKEFSQAIGEFLNLVQYHPKSPLVPSSLLKVGDAYYNLKKYPSAIETYVRLVRGYPKSKEAPEADFGILLALQQEKRWDAFIGQSEILRKRYPQHPLTSQALMMVGDHYGRTNMKEKAVKTYRDVILLSADSDWAMEAPFRITALLRQDRRWNDAIEEMEKFLKTHPKSLRVPEALVELGDLYVERKVPSKAIERFERVLQQFPQSPSAKRAYLGMERSYQTSGDARQAERVLKDLLQKFGKEDVRFEGYLRLGQIYLSQKRFGEATSAFSNAAQSPDERIASEAQFSLAEAHLGMGNREAAILQFSKVIYLYPNRGDLLEESWVRVGALYLEEGKFSEARRVYQKLLETTKREDRRETAKRMLKQIER